MSLRENYDSDLRSLEVYLRYQIASQSCVVVDTLSKRKAIMHDIEVPDEGDVKRISQIFACAPLIFEKLIDMQAMSKNVASRTAIALRSNVSYLFLCLSFLSLKKKNRVRPIFNF